MPRKAMTLPRSVVFGYIAKAANDNHIKLTNEKKEIIDDILNALPLKANTNLISTWCNKKVIPNLELYPEYSEESLVIREEVRKGIFYYLNRDRFNSLRKKLMNQDGEITPQIIKGVDPNFYSSLKTLFRRLDGRPDWHFVFEKLGRANPNYQTYAYYKGDKNLIIKALQDLLEQKNPDSWSPSWIDGAIYRRLDVYFKLDWEEILSRLDEKWRLRWNYSEQVLIRYNQDREKIASLLLTALQKHQPLIFSPIWVDDKARPVKDQVYSTFSGNWQSLISLLPEEWQMRWDYSPQKLYKGDKERVIKEIVELLEELQPETFSPDFFKGETRHLRTQVYKVFFGNWKRVISLLPSKWKKRWRHVSYTDETHRRALIKELEHLLLTENPQIIYPAWIFKRNRFLCRDLYRYFNADWQEVSRRMPKVWQAKWKRARAGFSEFKYSGVEEFNEYKEANRDYLFVFYSSCSDADLRKREELAHSIIALVRKGNQAAHDFFIESLKMSTHSQADRSPWLRAWSEFDDLLQEKIETCIFHFDSSQHKNFYDYLFRCLSMNGKFLKKALSLDKPLEDGGNLLDIMARYESEDQTELWSDLSVIKIAN